VKNKLVFGFGVIVLLGSFVASVSARSESLRPAPNACCGVPAPPVPPSI